MFHSFTQLDATDLRILAQLQPSCWDWSGSKIRSSFALKQVRYMNGAAAAGSLLTDKP